MSYSFTPATMDDIPAVRDLIQKRIEWMDKVGIEQWNKVNYWAVYPVSYFEEKVRAGELWVLRRENEARIIGSVVLIDQDDFWAGDDTPAYYIHNLATALDVKGVGAEIVALCEDLVRQRGCDRMRLDCTKSSVFLNRYYEEKGYRSVGELTAGAYCGIKREKLLK